MTIIASISFIITAAYIAQVVHWYVTWINTKSYKTTTPSEKGISVLIPFKDEASNLPRLIASLSTQTHLNWELILINDHSVDKSFDIATKLVDDFPASTSIINANGIGKKAALIEGAKQAKYDYLITTDADCFFSPEWLSTMANYYSDHNCDLLIGQVNIQHSKGLLSRFQQIDFASLQLSGGASAIQNKAIMCNGANLMCSKELYLQANVKPLLASGDDMFLLEWMKQQAKAVCFIKSAHSIVKTLPIEGFQGFLQQRARWAGKAQYYKDKHIIVSGISIGAVSFILFLLPILSLWNIDFLKLWSLILLFKTMADYMLLKAGSYDYQFKISLFELIFWQLIYPLYVVTVLLYSRIKKTTWKSRTI